LNSFSLASTITNLQSSPTLGTPQVTTHLVALTISSPYVNALSPFRRVQLHFWAIFLLAVGEGRDFAAFACIRQPFVWLGQSDGVFRLLGCRNCGK
jgi:hypothetical protein